MPVRLALKSRRSDKFTRNPIHVSVFEGKFPEALSKTKPGESPDEKFMKYKTNLAI